jgi:signal transduction histidine kinase
VFLLGGGLNTDMQTVPNDMQIGLVIEAVIIFIGIIYRYNLYKNDKEQLLLQLNKQQKETMQQIITAQEEERKRIAQDIHDDVGSTLGSLLLHISSLPGKQQQQDFEQDSHYQKSIAIGQKAISDLRAISHDLLPRDFTELGIFHILQSRVDELNAIGNIHFTLITEGDDKGIEPIFSITIYRIINELINNVLKHSQASSATVQLLMTGTEIIVMLEDNGVGMANNTGKGIGLKNVLSRTEFLHGKINIDDSAAGTSVIIEIPVENNNLQNRDEN